MLISGLEVLALKEPFFDSLVYKRAPLQPEERLIYFSQHFLGSPYKVFNLGEGHHDKLSPFPLYSFKSFDSLTFVEIVLALSISKNKDMFFKKLKKIRYGSKKISFQNRNHFPEVDWIPSILKNNILLETTSDVRGLKLKSITVSIDKPVWLKKFDLNNLGPSSWSDEKRRLEIDKIAGRSKVETVSMDYLSIESETNLASLNVAIESKASVVFILGRPKEFVSRHVGTDYVIVHAGILIKSTSGLVLRQATAFNGRNKVLDEPLQEFLFQKKKWYDTIGFRTFRIPL